MTTPMEPPDWQRVHDDFPINRNLIWLNSCGMAPMPGPVRLAMEQHLRTLCERGVIGVPTQEAVHDGIRARLARLLGAAEDELTLVHNTAEGLMFVSHGLRLHAGDRVVLLEHEYPSNVYPWQHWGEAGVALAFAPLADTPAAFLASLRPLLEPPTRVVSLSAVHWCTGMPLPLAEVGALCAARGVTLVVDGAQGVGLVPIDVRAAGIGAMAFAAWKWLLGPPGLGALYLRRDVMDGLRFPFKATGSVTDDHTYLPYRDTLKPGADRYVLSTPNYNDWIYFDASLRYLEQLGFAAVQARIQALALHLCRGLRDIGWQVTSDAFPDQRTGIVAAAPPAGHDAGRLVAALAGRNIVAAARLGRVRLAPHVFLLEAQLDQVVGELRALTR
jgi:cysteine desulfurase/selenocysteine lyase